MGGNSSKAWDPSSMPDQTGKTAIITGANCGLGLEATKRLTEKGCTVVMACRSKERAEKAIAEVLEEVPSAKVEFMELDLCSFDSVRSFAKEFSKKHPKLNLLVNNAGIMIIPWGKSKDGNEIQMQANHLGHFLLTGLLLDKLKASAPSRIINHSSSMHRASGGISFDTWNDEKSYSSTKQYGESKLANLLFSLELKKRLAAKAPGVTVAACHPGYTHTNLQFTEGKPAAIMGLLNACFAQKARVGAQPLLYATVGEDIVSGDFTGPCGVGNMAGPAVKETPSAAALSEAAAEKLWALSAKVTGLDYLN